MDVSEFDTLDEYKEDIRKDLAEEGSRSKIRERSESNRKIVEKASMEVPDAMVDSQIDRMVDEFAGRMQAQGAYAGSVFPVYGSDV